MGHTDNSVMPCGLYELYSNSIYSTNSNVLQYTNVLIIALGKSGGPGGGRTRKAIFGVPLATVAQAHT